MLKRLGYTVLLASSGAEALEKSREHQGEIALLLTDVIMPNMSGAELAGELRRSRPDIKIVYVSGYTEHTVSHHGVLDANVTFLAKPFSREALAKKLRETLGQSKRRRKT
jgi:CheY-like chemotaxis protein